MNQKLTINVLGPLEVQALGKHIFIRNRRLRTLLTVLALSPGEPVTLPDLVDAIWPTTPPLTAMHQVRKALSSLREILPDGWDSIRTTDTGYIILLEPAQSDFAAFRALVSRAQTELPRGQDRADMLVAALRLWRGLPGRGDLHADSRFVSDATQQWRTVLADAVNMLTSLNREPEARQMVDNYAALVGSDETTQNLTRQMRNAAGAWESEAVSGTQNPRPPAPGTRQGSAVQGMSPGTGPVRARGLPGGAPENVITASTGARRNALPPRDPLFSGRAGELEKIISYLNAEKRRTSPTVLIHGPVGVGKSALATEVAYRVLPSYPTGVFYLNAESAADEPLTEVGAVTQLLLQIEGMWRDLPDEPAARVALWRGLLASQASVILIDNYAGDFDLRQILPNGERCASIITSRYAVLGITPGLSCRIYVMDDYDSGALAKRLLAVEHDEIRRDNHVREIIRRSHGMPSVIRCTCNVIREVVLGRFRETGVPAIRVASNLTPSGGYRLRNKMAAAMRSLDEECRVFLAILSLTPTPEYTYDLMVALSGGASENTDKIIVRLLCESFLLLSESATFVLPRVLYEYLREKRNELAPPSHLTVAADRYREFIGAMEIAGARSCKHLSTVP